MASSQDLDPAMPEWYPYTPLNTEQQEIRLVRLLPGEIDDPMCIEVFHKALLPSPERLIVRMSLSEVQETLPSCCLVQESVQGRYLFQCEEHGISWSHPDLEFDHRRYKVEAGGSDPSFEPNYEALSYVWGSTENLDFAFIKIPGSSALPHPFYKLEIRQNLACALRHLRRSEASRVIWIDAICINQNDIDERNIQVKRMANIYTLANRVLVWLDPNVEGSSLAVRTLGYLGSQVVITTENTSVASPGAEEPLLSSRNVDLPYTPQVWTAIEKLCRQEWFTRLWVFQEIKLANKAARMVCGSEEIDWIAWCAAMACICTKNSTPPSFPRHQIHALMFLFFEDNSGMNFLSLLSFGSTMRCADLRDHIYGLLGLASKSILSNLRVDYSLSVEEVYKQTMLSVMQHYRRTDALGYCFLTHNIEGMPSWVRNWSTSKGMPFVFESQFCSGFSCADIDFEGPNTLHVTGVQCLSLCEVSERFSDDPQQVNRLICQWQPKDEAGAAQVAGRSSFDAYLSSLQQDHFSDRFPSISMSRSSWKETYLAEIVPRKMTTHIYPVARAIRDLQARVFIRTVEGDIGVGPVGSRIGDIVCVLLGCSAPIVLRPISGNTFKVIGECYMYGLSDSVGLLGLLPDGWSIIGEVDVQQTYRFRYVNSRTGVKTIHDPRLGPLPEGWEWVPSKRTSDDPKIFEKFHNTITGEMMNSDPRMLPKALLSRGVPLRTFSLV